MNIKFILMKDKLVEIEKMILIGILVVGFVYEINNFNGVLKSYL